MESSSSSISSMDYTASTVSDSDSSSLDSSRTSSFYSSSPSNSGSETSPEAGGVENDFVSVMFDEKLHEPLYPGSNMSSFQSYQQIFHYGIRHRLTKVAFSELLELVANHLPTKSMLSLYKLRKFFMTLYSEVGFKTHYCCSSCHSPLLSVESTCVNRCETDALEFMSIDVGPQLKRRLEGMSKIRVKLIICALYV